MSPSLGSVRRLCWAAYFGLLIGGVLGLPSLGLGCRLYTIPLTTAGWYTLVFRFWCPLTCMPITACVAFTVSSGFILDPSPYRMVNTGLCDYKKKKKKNCFCDSLLIGSSIENPS